MKLISSVLMFCTLSSPLHANFIVNSSEVSTIEEDDSTNFLGNVSVEKSTFNVGQDVDNIDAENSTSHMVKKILFYLKNTIRENDESKLIEFINDNKNSDVFLKGISIIFSDQNRYNDQLYFINILLASDIEIFDYWYKLALLIASNSSFLSLARRASDILDYYSEDFALVNLSDVFD